ncbi:MAG TPA: FAD-dependent oxidoreductase [Candidatus Binatia bacterium]|nr:FAD-dependent oxidoreductase [Candidatus Binatia bacterium]
MRVIVVGAGPAGASIAYLLARRGIDVTLVERHTDFAREFRGEALMASGRSAVAEMGLADELARVPHVRLAELEIFRGERRLAVFGMLGQVGGISGPEIVSQPAMLEMLVEQASRLPSFRIERGATVRDVLRDDAAGGRIAGVRIDGAGGERELRADLVIGADGRTSTLRKRTALDLDVTRYPQAFDIVWFKVPLPAFAADLPRARAYLGRGHAALMFPSYDDRLQIGWIIDKGSFGELRARGIDAWLEAMREHVSRDLSEHLARHRGDVSHPFLLDVVCDRVARWTAPGLLLVGDAAHAMSPVGAQGINLALRDAIVVANELVPVLARDGAAPAEIDAAAARVQAVREPEVVAIQQLQQGPPPVLFGHAWWSRLVIDHALPFLVRTGIAQAVALPTLRRLTTGVADVHLRV